MQYDSTGTVEFVVDGDTEEFFFLEMNTRLQVEHPVTEAITGLDLVELQLRSAVGEALPLAQPDVRFEGHAFEARINAEDASADFAPQIGRITQLRIPEGVRWESGVELGSEVTPHYDAMLAKLVVHGTDRAAARGRLATALDALLIGPLVTNTGFQRWLVDRPELVEGRITTRFLDETTVPVPDAGDRGRDLAARAWLAARAQVAPSGPWTALASFRTTPHRGGRSVVLRDRQGETHEVCVATPPGALGAHLECERGGTLERVPVAVDLAAREVALNLDGQTHTFEVLSRSQHWAPAAFEGEDASEATRAPFPAVVTELPVAAGDAVSGDDVVVVIEAMKMLHSLTARGSGVVKQVHVEVGESVDSNQILVSYETPEGD